MRFKRVKVDSIYFKEAIEEDFKAHPMPDKIWVSRNRAIIYLNISMVCALSSLILYARRRGRVILGACIFSIFLSIIGMIGTIKINSVMLFIHSFLGSSIFGAFYAYLVIEMLFLAKNKHKDSSSEKLVTDSGILFIYSLPFFVIFLVGCHSFYLFNMVYDERN